jgi:hypothetical protein
MHVYVLDEAHGVTYSYCGNDRQIPSSEGEKEVQSK